MNKRSKMVGTMPIVATEPAPGMTPTCDVMPIPIPDCIVRDFNGVDHVAKIYQIHVDLTDLDARDLVVNNHAPQRFKRSDEPKPMTWRHV